MKKLLIILLCLSCLPCFPASANEGITQKDIRSIRKHINNEHHRRERKAQKLAQKKIKAQKKEANRKEKLARAIKRSEAFIEQSRARGTCLVFVDKSTSAKIRERPCTVNELIQIVSNYGRNGNLTTQGSVVLDLLKLSRGKPQCEALVGVLSYSVQHNSTLYVAHPSFYEPLIQCDSSFTPYIIQTLQTQLASSYGSGYYPSPLGTLLQYQAIQHNADVLNPPPPMLYAPPLQYTAPGLRYLNH